MSNTMDKTTDTQQNSVSSLNNEAPYTPASLDREHCDNIGRTEQNTAQIDPNNENAVPIPEMNTEEEMSLPYLPPIEKKDMKDLSERFSQITIDGYDSMTGLDIYKCTFEEVLQKCEVPPKCIKFIDIKQRNGDILPKTLINLPYVEAIDISECGIREIPEVLLQMKQLRVLKAADNHISSLPDDWEQLDLTALDVSKNAICEVSSSINNLSNLQILLIADCNLKYFPAHVLQLKQLRTLILDKNPIGPICDSKHGLNSVRALSLRSCLLPKIPEWLLSNLQHLDARDNSIQQFPTGLSEDMTVLKLGGNQLDIIPGEISHLQNLKKLDISSCGLKEFPKGILTLNKLQSLNIQNNFIHHIPEDTIKLDLRTFLIGQNPLDEFPDFCDQFANLEEIGLSSCFLEKFPHQIQKLTNLRAITVGNNCIEEIPETICQLRLKKLFMKGNPIRQLPYSFQDVQELEVLDLSSTKLKQIPHQILNLGHLKHLSMRNNAMETLPDDWNKCVNIKHLDLSENLLSTLSSSIAQLQKLEIFKLDSCSISEFPNVLLQLHCLRILSIAKNLISTLPHNFGQLNLQYLNIKENLLQHLPDAICSNSKLLFLNLSACRFREFPEEILKLKNLKYLFIDDNEIPFLPNDWQGLSICTLSLHSNPLVKLDRSFGELKTLTTLCLDNCLLTEIPAYFNSFVRLSDLSIFNNNMTSVDLNMFPPNLIYLKLSKNPLGILPKSIGYDAKLYRLSLRNCGLREFPSFICSLKRLQQLCIGQNHLKYIPAELKDTILHYLDVSRNPLEHLYSLDQLKTLRNLVASGCRLELFPRVVMNLPKLKELHLNFNAIRVLPDDLEHYNLTELSLAFSRLESLPQSLTNLTSLHTLNLSHVKLKDFPRVLLDMHSLTKLHLSGFQDTFLSLPTSWKNLRQLQKLKIFYFFDLTSLQTLGKLVDLTIFSSRGSVPVVQGKFLNNLSISLHKNHSEHALPDIQNALLLTSLDVSGYKLSHLPDSLAELTSLEKLSITGCYLKAYPEILNKCLAKLKVLHISQNSFFTLPEVWICRQLVDMDLSGTPLDIWCHSLTQLLNLTKINISGCRLNTVPDVLLQLKKLEDLNIGNNYITHLPTNWHTVRLKRLNLSDNSLVEGWPLNSLEQLSKLTALDISGNRLKQVPKAILLLKYLSDLNMSNNPLCVFPICMRSLYNLEIFTGSACKLEAFPSFLLDVMKIRVIKLDNNKIRIIPSHWNSVSLEELVLDNNPLQLSRDTLSGVGSLYSLRLSSCHLKEIPALVSNIPILSHLNIENNAITRISEEIYREIQRIREVQISTAMLKEPPREIYEAGYETVEQYYRDLKLSQACKVGFHNVVLLGSTTAGKTSLIKSLMSGESVLTEQEDRTIVVDTETWELTEDLHFHITDFGGHDVYELVYPIFLKDREASILIAVDLSNISFETIERNLFKWLYTVLNITGESSEVIVVGTKGDLCDDEAEKICYLEERILEWKRKHLKHVDEIVQTHRVHKYNESQIKHFKKMAVREIRTVVTSCVSMTGFDKLKTILLNQSREKAVKLPGSWFDLYKSVSHMKSVPSIDRYITIKQLQPQCPKSMKTQNMNVCLKYLHQRGMVLWYENDSKLRDYVFYDVTFCIEILKSLLLYNLDLELGKQVHRRFFRTMNEQKHAVHTFRLTGFMPGELLGCIWRDVIKNDDMYNLAITLLKLFRLCYEEDPELVEEPSESSRSAERTMKDTKRLLYFPWFLRDPIEEDEFTKIWPKKVPFGNIPLKCVFTFEHCIPTSLYEQFSVQLQSQLSKGHKRKEWKNTIHVVQSAVHLLVQKNEDTEQDRASLIIQIRTKTENASQMYKLCVSVVRDVQLLMKIFLGILYEEYYVCPHCIMTNAHDPTALLLDDALGDYPADTKFVCCKDDATEIPAALHYPRLLDTNSRDTSKHYSVVQSFLEEQEMYSVSARSMDSQVSDINLLAVSKYIADESEMYDIGVNLGLPLHQIRSIRTNQPLDINLASSEVLNAWKQERQEQGHTTQQMKEELQKVLKDMGKHDALDVLNKSHSPSKKGI